MDKKQAITVVKIISILGYIGAGLGILSGIILLFGGAFIAGMMPLADIPALTGALIGAAITVLSIVIILFSIFCIFLARALWNHKKWARIVFIVFSVIAILANLFSLPAGVIGVVINGFIVYFLAFDTQVMKLFK
jgi:hypothetical protein